MRFLRTALEFWCRQRNILQSILNSDRVQQGKYLYAEMDNGFALGVGRGNYSYGYWYLAIVNESNTGCDIDGTIKAGNVYDGEFQIVKEALLDRIGFVFLIILFLPILLLFWCIMAFRRFVMKKKDSTYEEEVDNYMINDIGCRHLQ